MNYSSQTYQSPVGALRLVARGDELWGVYYPKFLPKLADVEERETAVLRAAKAQLDEYFAGERRSFDLPLALTGTEFQRRVWQALVVIPYGETRSYKQQAAALSSPSAPRAVGRANGLNPLSIILPCHRVVGSNGALTGYAGGLEAKRYLLQLEADPTTAIKPALGP